MELIGQVLYSHNLKFGVTLKGEFSNYSLLEREEAKSWLARLLSKLSRS